MGKMPTAGADRPVAADWKRMRFRNNKVWLAVDAQGRPVSKSNRVLIKYQLEQPHEYWVNRDGISALGENAGERRRPDKALPDDAIEAGSGAEVIEIYTDGASSGNPGPAGIGVLMRYASHRREISEHIGVATNNVAELKAIEAALAAVKNKRLPVRIFTDSSYAYGLLACNWKARKNRDLVERIRRQIARFPDLQLIKVKGHAGEEGNERADFLATEAIRQASRAG
jgi:ribonuclease HI